MRKERKVHNNRVSNFADERELEKKYKCLSFGKKKQKETNTVSAISTISTHLFCFNRSHPFLCTQDQEELDPSREPKFPLQWSDSRN